MSTDLNIEAHHRIVMRIKILLFLLGGIVFLTPKINYGQELPNISISKIEIEQQPWQQPEITPAPRSFAPKKLEHLLVELLRYNPHLSALIEKIRALEKRVSPAGSLADPRLSFEGSNIPFNPPALNRTPMTGLQIYYRQKVPWPGKLKLKKHIAASKAAQEKQIYYEQLNQLVAKFKQTFYDYLLTTKLLKIHQTTIARFNGLEKILSARYSAGEAPQQDILKNKVTVSNLKETIIELQQRQKILLAQMNMLLNRPKDTLLRLSPVRYSASPLKIKLPRLLKIAETRRPWLKKSELEIQEAKLQHNLAKKSLLPDFDFGAGYRIRQNSPGDPVGGGDFFSAGLTINLPVFAGRKQKQEIQASYHQTKMQEHLKTATIQEVRFQVETIFHQLQQFKKQLRVLNSQALPQARAAVASSRVNYEADEVDFLNVLTNEVALLNQQLKHTTYRYEYEKNIAELEMATGLPIQLLNQRFQDSGVTHEKP